jgi:hypothetical protein
MDQTMATVVDLFASVHQQLRDLVKGMDEDQLNWSPGSEMNSTAVLVTHTLASELDTLTLVRDVPNERDRDAEFRSTATSADDLLAVIDRADARLAEHAGAITADDLAATRTRPNRDPQIGLHWLLNNYGHAREHLAHLSLTAQLYQQRDSS